MSFLGNLKRKLSKGSPSGAPTAAAPASARATEKATGSRMSKTVMPSATRHAHAPEPFGHSTAGTAVMGTPSASPTQPRSVPFSMSGATLGANDAAPAVAAAMQPTTERVISLELREVVAQVPPGWIRAVSDAEANRRVALKAIELEKGMSSGRPSASLTSIYHQVPEIFLQPVPDSEDTQVPLPFQKVLEQFTALQPRSDQLHDTVVPQVETPFLRVTLEDNSKFGTKTQALQTADKPPVKVEPAIAKAIAAAEPEAVAKEKISAAPKPIAPPVIPAPTPAPVRLTIPPPPQKETAPAPAPTPAPASPPPAVAPTRIPFKLSPIGTGAPASERVPASSGPSVPKVATKPETTAFAMAEKEAKPVTAERKILLPLKPILEALPPFQLVGDVGAVSEDARIEFRFSLVEPQLAAGRVVIAADEFAAALPNEFKGMFNAGEIAAPVTLPLQQVLANLPAESLRVRDDQVEEEKGAEYQTAFAAKAKEDAKRFNSDAPAAATAPPAAEPAPAPVVLPKLAVETSAPAKTPNESQAPAEAKDEAAVAANNDIDAKGIVARAAALPGVAACAIIFADGLSLAGNLPDGYCADGLCAMAPSLFQRVDDHMSGTQLGPLRCMTFFCGKANISLFMENNLCLAALHEDDDLGATARSGLADALHEISSKYSSPA